MNRASLRRQRWNGMLQILPHGTILGLLPTAPSLRAYQILQSVTEVVGKYVEMTYQGTLSIHA